MSPRRPNLHGPSGSMGGKNLWKMLQEGPSCIVVTGRGEKADSHSFRVLDLLCTCLQARVTAAKKLGEQERNKDRGRGQVNLINSQEEQRSHCRDY